MTTLTAATPTTPGGMVPGGAARAPAPQPGPSGADIFRIIRQRMVLILVLWAFFTVLAVGFTWFMARYFPQYRAHALVRVRSSRPESVLNTLEPQDVRQAEVELLVQNQALIVRSQEVLDKAVKDPQLKSTQWYRWAQEQEDEDLIDLLGDILSASPIRDSNFLRVGVTWGIPSEVPILVNTIVSKYLEQVNKFQAGEIRSTRDQLDKELVLKRRELEGKRREIEQLRSGADVWSAIEGGPSESLLTLEALATELSVDMTGRKTVWEQLMNAHPDDLPITMELQAILDADAVIRQLEGTLQNAEANLRLAEARFGRNHPEVKSRREARDAAAEQAAEERAVKQARYQSEQIGQARRNWLEAQNHLIMLGDQLQLERAKQKDKDKKYARYLTLVEERDRLRVELERLQEQWNILDMTLRLERTVQIDVPSVALEPKRLARPQWGVWIAVGVVLGLMISLGIALLLELADTSVRTPRDVLRVPVLGTIPTADDDEVEIQHVETAGIDAPHSIVAEAFRNLRANLFFSAPAEQQGVILVTSPSGGDGKTTISANLAISIALSGRRVLLIDANFRRAKLLRVFSSAREEGLSNILIGQGHLSDMAVSTSVPGLDVLGPGPTPPNPAELLGSSYLRDVVVDARSRYDQVIFDGPPVLLVSDALVLAGAVDGVLVVCQYRTTSRGALQRTQAQLDAINTRIFGAVLNQVETRAGGYFKKTYREFYEYQEPEEEGLAEARPKLDARPDEGELQPSAEPTLDEAGEPSGSALSEEVPQTSEPAEPSGTDDSAGSSPGASPSDSTDPSEGIEELDADWELGEDLDLGEDLKIDDDFDLGDDLDGPEEFGQGGDKPGP